MMKLLDAGEVQVGKVFSAEYDFTIPDYQRPYAWGKDETLQLLDDLEDAVARTTDEPYFLGSIVLVKQKGDPAAEVGVVRDERGVRQPFLADDEVVGTAAGRVPPEVHRAEDRRQLARHGRRVAGLEGGGQVARRHRVHRDDASGLPDEDGVGRVEHRCPGAGGPDPAGHRLPEELGVEGHEVGTEPQRHPPMVRPVRRRVDVLGRAPWIM